MMAKKTIHPTKPDCRDCVHSYEPHNRAYDGRFIFVKCPYFQWSRFATKDGCFEHFYPK